MPSFNLLRPFLGNHSTARTCMLSSQESKSSRLLQASSSQLFSTSPFLQTKTVKPSRLPLRLIPPYPYGERRLYKQSNRGLYGDARLRFGNSVAPAHDTKFPRTWKPNVHVKVFYCPSLGARVKTRLTLRVLKTISREGGLEEYLLKDKPARLKDLGPGGWNLRWLLMQTRAVQERFNRERRKLGVPAKEIVDNDALVQYVLDYATPGPLSPTSRRTEMELNLKQASLQSELARDASDGEVEFVLGNETLGEVDGVEELSDEAAAKLVNQADAKDAAVAQESVQDKAHARLL